MKRGANATITAAAAKAAARSASPTLELISDEHALTGCDGRVRAKDAGSVRSRRLRARPRTQARAAQRSRAARGSFRKGLLDTPHRRPAEEPRRPNEEYHEDDGETADEPHVAAERRPVRAEQVEEDAEREAADDGAYGTGQAAEHRGREGVEQDALHHVRVEEDDRRDHHSRHRAERRREAPAEREHPSDRHADEPALVRVDGGRAEAEPDLREAEEDREQRHRRERQADDADVLDREGRAPHVDRARREGAGELPHRAAPDPLRGAVEQYQEPDGDDHGGEDP